MVTVRSRPTPTPEQVRAWRTLLVAHSQVTGKLEGELMAAHGLPLAWYDVLLQLAEAPGARLRMTDLAESVLLSRSGVTRLVDRMVRAGLIARERCGDDKRITRAVLTDAGWGQLRAAAPTHLAGIEQHVVCRLSEAELGQLARLLGKLVDGEVPLGRYRARTDQP